MESKLSAANEELTANQQQAREIQDKVEELRKFKARIDEEHMCLWSKIRIYGSRTWTQNKLQSA